MATRAKKKEFYIGHCNPSKPTNFLQQRVVNKKVIANKWQHPFLSGRGIGANYVN